MANVKDQQTIIEYTLDYEGNRYPNRDFIFGIVGILYSSQFSELVETVYLNRHQKCEKKKDEMLEMSKEIKSLIIDITIYKSIYSSLASSLSNSRKQNFSNEY